MRVEKEGAEDEEIIYLITGVSEEKKAQKEEMIKVLNNLLLFFIRRNKHRMVSLPSVLRSYRHHLSNDFSIQKLGFKQMKEFIEFLGLKTGSVLLVEDGNVHWVI